MREINYFGWKNNSKSREIILFSEFYVSSAFQRQQDSPIPFGETVKSGKFNSFPHPRLFRNSRLVRKSHPKPGNQSGSGWSFSFVLQPIRQKSKSRLPKVQILDFWQTTRQINVSGLLFPFLPPTSARKKSA